MIFPQDDSNTKINMLDTGTGAGKWGKKGNGTKVKGSVVDHRITDKGVLIVTGKEFGTGWQLVSFDCAEDDSWITLLRCFVRISDHPNTFPI